jgi:hypothetical protein
MTKAEIDSAVAFNKKQGYSDEDVRFIQTKVGVTPDGVWGPNTVQAVAVWQSNNGLSADGKVGHSTWAKMNEGDPCECAEGVQIGCGLAAYDQVWPGRSPEEALQTAWDEAVRQGCTEIRFWSSEWLMDDFGNKGNDYSGPWLEARRVPSKVVVGAWVDDPVKVAKTPDFAHALARMHVTRASLMINKSNTRKGDVPWDLRWNRKDLEEIAKVYREHGIKLVCTTWPRPSKSMIDAMCADMGWILEATGSNVFEVDTEGNWTSQFLQGFKSMEEASQYLASKMRELVGADGEIELTTYTYHTENSSKAKLAPLMDRLLPQAYSVRHRGNQVIEWNDQLGPGKHQALAISRARQASVAK